jgi:hypothetical protein
MRSPFHVYKKGIILYDPEPFRTMEHGVNHPWNVTSTGVSRPVIKGYVAGGIPASRASGELLAELIEHPGPPNDKSFKRVVNPVPSHAHVVLPAFNRPIYPEFHIPCSSRLLVMRHSKDFLFYPDYPKEVWLNEIPRCPIPIQSNKKMRRCRRREIQ